MAQQRFVRGLYVIVDPQHTRGRDAVEVARLALEGGASVIQWRDKLRDKGEQLVPARAIREFCTSQRALFIVNDHVDLALSCGADGVHLGQKDLPVEAVRKWIPVGFLVGVSTNDVDEARRAEQSGADYVGVGSIFPSGTKGTTRPASPERLREVKQAVGVQVVAVGGISEENVDLVLAAGADAVAVISAVCAADDVREAARCLASRFG
ncbi:MAG: thiamine phosphate synthase [Dehalococcoidia bacterium]|jgi:thiamine-phosphate diphosphorylase